MYLPIKSIINEQEYAYYTLNSHLVLQDHFEIFMCSTIEAQNCFCVQLFIYYNRCCTTYAVP